MKRPSPRPAPGDRKSGITHRNNVLVPAAIFLLAVALRVLFVFFLRETPFFLEHFSDTKLYMQLVSQINGDGIGHAYFMSPLYPYIIAVIEKVTGSPELWGRFLQSVFGGLTALITYFIGKRGFGSATGIVAGAVVALYVPFIYYDGLLLTESLFTLLLSAQLLALLSAMEKKDIRYWAAAGVLLGLAAITRASILLFLPAFLVSLLFLQKEYRPNRSHIAVYTILAFLTLLPTTWHNAAEEKVFIPVTTSFGYNLYAGNNAEATGLYSMPASVDLASDFNGSRWIERNTGREMNSAEASAWWRDAALEWMTGHPGDAAILYMKKLLLFFHPGEIDQLGLSMRFFKQEYGAIPGIPAAAFPVLFVLSVIGLLIALRERNTGWIIPAYLFVYVFSTALFFISGRLRLPIMPLLILYAAHTLVVLVQRFRNGSVASLRNPAAAGTIIALCVMFLLQPEVRQGFEQEYIKLGQVAFKSADYPESERLFRASLSEQESVDAMVNLGNALAAQNRSEEAAAQYRRAIAKDSTAALAWFNFGNLRMQTGSPQYAYGYWKKAIACDPYLSDARRNFGLLLMQAGRLPEAEAELMEYLKLEPDASRRSEISRDLEKIGQILRQEGK